jgi:hypothetical protein
VQAPRGRSRFARLAAPWIAVILTAFPAAAQISGSTGVNFESYRFAEPASAGIESVSLLTVPVTAHAALFGPVSLQVRGGFARGALLTAGGEEIDLTGPTDTEIQLGVNLGSGPLSATVTGIFVAPTGASSLSPGEAVLAAFVGSEFLPFRIRTWGMGGAAGLSLTAARSFGDGSIGFGAGYIATREYTPFRTPGSSTPPAHSFMYRPGNQLQLRFAADRNLNRASKVSFAVVFERSEEDLLDDENLYQAGNRYQAMASYAFASGARSTAILYAGGLRSDEGTALMPSLNHDVSARTLFLAGGGMRVPVGGLVLVPSVDARVYRRGSGFGQGYLAGVGTAVEFPAGNLAVTPSARLRLGNLVASEGVESGITGLDLGLDIRFGR